MNEECYNNGECIKCGCATTALQMCNKMCKGMCYPRMMNKWQWDYFTEFKIIRIDDFYWKLEGDKLIIEGEVEEQKGKMALTVESVSADKLTLALTAEDLIAQVKEQMPEAMNMVPGEFDIDAMAKGTSMSMSFNR